MDLDSVFLVSPKITPLDPATVDASERELGMKLPAGYREFVCRFGPGLWSGFVRVRTGEDLLVMTQSRRAAFAEHWFWDHPELQELARVSVLLADSIDGDEVVWHPDLEVLVMLPRHEAAVVQFADFDDLISRWAEQEPLTVPTFAPFIPMTSYNAKGTDYDTVRDALLGLGLHALENLGRRGGARSTELYFPDMGGQVSVSELDEWPVYVHVRHDAALTDEARPVLETLGSAGVAIDTTW